MLGSVEQLAFQTLGLTVRAVGFAGRCVPEGIILSGVGNIPGITDLEGIGTLQIPEIANGIGEDHTFIGDVAQIFTQRVLQDSGSAVLRGGEGHGDLAGGRIIVALGVTEIVLLTQISRGSDIPALDLFKGIQIVTLGDHDFFLEFHVGCAVVTSIEQIIDIVNLHHRAGADPCILTAAAGGFQNRCVILRVGHKVGGGCQINGMVVGIAAIFQIVDVVDTVFVVGHGVAHIGLIGSVHAGQEIGGVFIGGFLTAGGSEGGEILVVAAGLDLIGSICIPQSVQGQIGLNLVFAKVPGGGHGCVRVPALQHIAIPLYIFRLGDLAALFQRQGSGIFAAVGVKGNGVGAAGGAAAQQQTENQQYPDQAFFHKSLLVSVALAEGM